MPRIAYLILAHGLPYQTIDLLWSIWREEDFYFVHFDRKSPPVAAAAIAAIASSRRNIYVVPPVICTWGGFSLVDAAQRCIGLALSVDDSWSHAALISGTHLPLQRAASLASSLEPNYSFLTFHDFDMHAAELEPPNFWSGVARRLTYEYQEVPGLGCMRGPGRLPPPNVTFYWGSQWWILSRSAAEFVWASRDGVLADFFRKSYIPDETYIQTLLANSHLKSNLRVRQIVWQKWEGGRPKILSDEDIASARTSNQFFARKASEATMQDKTGILERSIASVDRIGWVESVMSAFSGSLPPSMCSTVCDGYQQRGSRPDARLYEKEVGVRSLIEDASERIHRCARDLGCRVHLSSRAPAVNEAMLICEFPDSRTRAHYFLILRVCNLEIAWLGLYLKPPDLDNAAKDLQDFPDSKLIDFSFPAVVGLKPYHSLLEYGVRLKGVIWLDGKSDAKKLEAVIQDYLEVLSRIPGLVG